MLIAAAILLMLFALLLLGLSGSRRRELGLPEGHLVYSDTGAEQRIEQPLFADDLGLLGKPDYLIDSSEGLIPVEVKSGRSPQKPYDAHIYQLAAYCLLVTRNFKKRPPYGIIRYPQRSFRIDFTRELEAKLLALLADMRSSLLAGELHRSHSAAARCRACGYGQLCGERL